MRRFHPLSGGLSASPVSPPTPEPHPLARATSLDDVPQVIRQLSQSLARSAVERDRQGGHASAEREQIRASGLLGLSVPTVFGGLGAPWPAVLRGVRELARVDASLAHVFAFHHLQMATVLLHGDAGQHDRLLRATTQAGWFWGNAFNPQDRRALALGTSNGFRIRGTKSFCSGSVGADMLVVSAWHEPSSSLLVAAVPTSAHGLDVRADWDAFGQRQTDSGTVHFRDVHVSRADVLLVPGAVPSPHASLRTLIAQLILANLYLGIGQGAFGEALRYAREEARPWHTAPRQRPAEDPYAERRYGEFQVMLRGAEALADEAAEALQKALDTGPALDAASRGDVALRVSEAKVLAHRAGLDVSGQFLELTGARSCASLHGLDRYWRNVRVHTLHDPLEPKLRDLGRHALTGQYPEPGFYT